MPKLDITALDAELRSNKLRPIYLVVGPEMHLRRTAVQMITQTVLGKDEDSSAKKAFIGKEARSEALYDALHAISMFTRHNFVVVRDGEKVPKDTLEMLTKYAVAPAEGAVLLIDAEKLDGRSKFMRTMEKGAAVVECKLLYANQLPSWINMEARRKGKKISMEAARFLGDMVGSDLGQLSQALERVSLYVGNRQLIELRDIEEAVVETAQRTVFELGDAIGSRKVDRAIAILSNLIEAGQSPVFILSMISRHVRILIKAREIGNRVQDTREISRYLGVHPFFAKNYVTQANNFSAQELRRFFNALARCDRSLKSSRLPRERILEKLLFELCGRGGVKR